MEQTPLRSTPKDVFLHLFNIVTFYLSIIGFITLFIQYINALFPDKLNYYFTNIANGVRWSTSVLLIAVIAYLVTSWMLEKDLYKTPEKRNLKLRKWLVYFTLFISAITIIIDLMTFVYNFLSGELTVRFVLKVLVVLLVAAAVFGYYLWDLKRSLEKTKIPMILAGVVSAIVLGSIIAGFFIIGTPTDQRARRFDDERVQDLQMIQSEIVNYWVQKRELPVQLSELNNSITGFIAPLDPKTNEQYEYLIANELSFELCVVFERVNKDITPAGLYFGSPYDSYNQNWSHDAGRVCFSRTIDPELYPEDVTKPVSTR
ncbi:MAG TPA: hypothetical protein DCS29_01555 [Candidatus Magasanikbacteria bacterium]|nr:MAG: hypothetical protein A2479_02655 [Candidatus Magasanikbacteria bacterium RIFOXYC2_FULL_39_8]HAT03446.1 hypothetical protein [Candidatus Magasanikbacteria bacterium]